MSPKIKKKQKIQNIASNIMNGDIMNGDVVDAPPFCPLRKVIRASWSFYYLCPNKCFLHHKYAKKGLHKEFALQWFFVAILRIYEVTCKMNTQKALKLSSFILDVDHVKLSLRNIFLTCLMESFYTSFQDLPFLLSKTHTKKPQI